ncbi:membrane protein [sediment metagenome]|uniref:Membrane protein n=1 Tax=sediment metagenome TaxID=749907 RepID=D9PKC2_9ZZZZ
MIGAVVGWTRWASAQESEEGAQESEEGAQAESEAGAYYYTEYRKQWYGWQTLAFDVPSLATFYVAQSKGEGGIALGALGVFVVGAPLVHVAHGEPKRGILSASMHLLLPVVGLVAVYPGLAKAMPDVSEDTQTAMAVTMAGAGAAVFDTLVLAWDEEEVLVPISGTVGPRIVGVGSGAVIGVGGTF